MRKRIALFMMVLVMSVMALCACGSGKSPVVGEWNAKEVGVSGITLDVKTFSQMAGTSPEATLSIKKDGKFVMNLFGEYVEGTWKYSEPTCTLTSGGESIDVKYSDGTLEFYSDGVRVTFEK